MNDYITDLEIINATLFMKTCLNKLVNEPKYGVLQIVAINVVDP